MIFTKDRDLRTIIESFRDWGRDCYCGPGCDNTCGKHFVQQLGSLPMGYDHKYTYSHMGYNLRITEMQAACALAQMDRLPDFIAARKRNFDFIKERLRSCEESLILPEPTAGSKPSPRYGTGSCGSASRRTVEISGSVQDCHTSTVCGQPHAPAIFRVAHLPHQR